MTQLRTEVLKINDGIIFKDGSTLYDFHNQDCCENHYLDFSSLCLADFEGLEFDLSSPSFFERVSDFGIRLIPLNGHAVSIPGYGYNNGYYSSDLTLVLSRPGKLDEKFDITECQDQKDY